MQTTFFKPVVEKLKAAGCEILRGSRNSHLIFRTPKGNITVPTKLDDRRKAQTILKSAGLRL